VPKTVEVDEGAPEVPSLERAKFLRRNEQSLLSGGGSNDGQPAQAAARVASDNEDRGAHRLESAETRRLTLRRLIQTLLADFIEKCVRLFPQFSKLPQHFVERRIIRGLSTGSLPQSNSGFHRSTGLGVPRNIFCRRPSTTVRCPATHIA
jgi:hypothetical protein